MAQSYTAERQIFDEPVALRRKKRWGWTQAVAWLPLVAVGGGAYWFMPSTWPAWANMWLVAVGVYASCKWLTWRLEMGLPRGQNSAARYSWPRAVAWWCGWPGMDAARFCTSKSGCQHPTTGEWLAAAAKFANGIAAVFFAAQWLATESSLVAIWLGMAGYVLALHCGLFHLLSCAWRSRSIDARPIMRAPLLADSVSNLWGQRWNLAFRDVGYLAVFRPVARRHGAPAATLATFAFSGVIHDVVMSLPAGGGFGLPTLYFLLQGLAVLIQNRRTRGGISAASWRQRLATVLIVVLPAPLLLHPPFLRNVVEPFFAMLGRFFV